MTFATPQLDSTVSSIKQLVDAHLDQLTNERRTLAAAVDTSYERLWAATAAAAQGGGKRIRPYMLTLSYEMYASQPEIDAIVPACAAIELLHSAMLVHDDIMDRDEMRRGAVTINRQYTRKFASQASPHDATHHGNSVAILSGDLLLSEAYFQVQQCTTIDRIFLGQALTVMHEAVQYTIGGQLLDIEYSLLPADVSIDYELVARCKTACYSFVAPLLMGASLAGAPHTSLSALRDFAITLGVAYQLRDDLLGSFGDESITGKSAAHDIREGKKTELTQHFLTHAPATERREFLESFGRADMSVAELARCRTLLERAGSRTFVESRISSLHQKADDFLVSGDFTPRQQWALQSINDLVAERAA